MRSSRDKIENFRKKHQDISSRVQANQMAAGMSELTYYSAWYWSAIHVLLSIPAYRKSGAISNRLGLPTILVEQCLTRLQEIGLIEKKGHEWKVKQDHLHLQKNSALMPVHHTNWRLQAAAKAAMRDQDSLQYSVVTAVSAQDAQRLKNMLLEFIEKSRQVIAPSKEEELIYIGLDCFRV
jgi:predicted transcriptional regulator